MAIQNIDTLFTKPHPHAELMLQYAQDAMETDKPWERVGYQPYPFKPPNEDTDGWSEWQMWALMHSLGKYLMLGGSRLPFETEIEILE